MTTIEEELVAILAEKQYTLATAESCTGGLLAGTLINVSGISSVFQQGYITYANEAKVQTLHVKQETLDQHGAVSAETAIQMAQGARGQAHTDVAISTTGIAGPNGGTASKPVGLVYIGCCVKDIIKTKELRLNGTRKEIREQAVHAAIAFAIELI